MTIRISVIIPAINEALTIERAIRSSLEMGADEVLVVDGGSSDQTIELARCAGARVFVGRQGRAVQQNLGAQHATGDVLLFLHADNWLVPEAGSQVRECLQNAQVLGGAFLQQIEAEGCPYRWLECGNAARVRLRGLPYGDQAIFMRRHAFEQLGGFPEVRLMEDMLLMRRFRRLSKPALLPGPVHVSARRWQHRGVALQTLCNWSLLAAEAAGVAPDRLARFYPKHDN